jgi:hypothetical protein
MSCRLGIAALTLLLASCSSGPPQPQLPKVVYVQVDHFVPIDPSLLGDCPIDEPADDTVGARVEVAKLRKTSLQRCNADKAAIRASQPVVH